MDRSGYKWLIGLLMLLAAGKPILYDTLDPDCFWHLRVADQLMHDGIGPVVDRLSFSSIPEPWTPYSWGAELLMRATWSLGGYRAAVFAQSIMQALTIGLLGLACAVEPAKAHGAAVAPPPRRGERSALSTALVVFAGLFMTLPYLSFRPVTMGFVILFGCAALLRRGGRLAWLAVPLTAVYANVHLFVFFVPALAWMYQRHRSAGQLPISPGVTTPGHAELTGPSLPRKPAFLDSGSIQTSTSVSRDVEGTPVAERVRPPDALPCGSTLRVAANRKNFKPTYYLLSGSLIISIALASIATPMLPGLIHTTIFYSSSDVMVAGPVISEMQSFARGPFGWASAVFAGLLLLALIRRWRDVPVRQWVGVIVATALMLKIGRFAPVFVVVVCPIAASVMPPLNDRILGKTTVRATLLLVLVLGIARVTLAFPGRSTVMSSWLNRHGDDAPGYPCAAADFVDATVPRVTSRIINEFSWGGYLEWRLGDRYQTLLDGRTQVFPPSLWRALYLGTDDDRRQYLSGISADAAVLPAGHSRFEADLSSLGWAVAYRDGRAEVMTPPGTKSASRRSAPTKGTHAPR